MLSLERQRAEEEHAAESRAELACFIKIEFINSSSYRYTPPVPAQPSDAVLSGMCQWKFLPCPCQKRVTSRWGLIYEHINWNMCEGVL